MTHTFSRLGVTVFLLFAGFSAGCSKTSEPATKPAAPVTETSVPGGKIIVPANVPPQQQEEIKRQQMDQLERNRQATPPNVPGTPNK